MEIKDYIKSCSQIKIYNDGKCATIDKTCDGYEAIIVAWGKMTEKAIEMPAFGVSLNSYTLEQLKRGLWVEFVFEKETYHCEMPFLKLLVNIVSDYKGFNIIRYTKEDGYFGRCYYLQLATDMSEFEKIVRNIYFD